MSRSLVETVQQLRAELCDPHFLTALWDSEWLIGVEILPRAGRGASSQVGDLMSRVSCIQAREAGGQFRLGETD